MPKSNEQRVSVELTEEDKANMRAFLRDLYHQNPAIVDNWQMNAEVFDIVQEILAYGAICSDNMEFVPKPTDLVGGRGIKAAKEILKSIAKRVAKDRITDAINSRKPLEFICKTSISRAYRTALESAGNGL